MAREFTVEEIMAILPETPRRIAALTAGLTPIELRASPEQGAWSINEILAHLRASHDVLGGNMLRIVAEDRPTWRRLSPRAWMRKTDYATWEFAPGFDVFTKQRADLLAVLEPIRPADWERTAVVIEGPGKTLDRSLRYYGDWMAGHELVHLEQIAQIATGLGAEGAA